jgi:ornithine cyclodeaminase
MNQKIEFIYLSQEDVIAAGGLEMKGTLEVVETSFRLHASGDTILPKKPVLRWGGPETEETLGRIMAMPAYLGGDLQISGIKWIPSKPSNPYENNLPRANAVIILNEFNTLMPIAIMDGTIISAMRTGAASGVAAKYLARPESEVLGMVGAGVQMRTQLMAMKEVLPNLKQGYVFDLNQEKAEAFAAELGQQVNLPIEAVTEAKTACQDADVFVTATMSSYAYVEAGWYKPGALHCEVSFWDTHVSTLSSLDKVFCDDYEMVAGHGVDVAYRAVQEGVIPREKVFDIGDVIIQKVPGRESDDERMIFNPIGMGIHDVSEAYRVFKVAKAKNIGQVLPLWENPLWT